MPGHRGCAVFNCKNVSSVTKAMGKTIAYHCFPRGNDLLSAARRREWIRCCSNRTKKVNPKHSQICSEHFTANDYERDLRNELLGLPTRTKLKKTAIPTLNLPLGVTKNHPEDIQSLQSRPTNSKICKDSAQIELIMCDNLPLAVVENCPKDIQRLAGRKRRRKGQNNLNNSSPLQSNKKTKSHKDPPQIELIMCDGLPPAGLENEPKKRLARNQSQRKVQDIFNSSFQHQSTNLESHEDPPQIELIMCDDLPLAVVENQPQDLQTFTESERQLGDQDILYNSLQSQSIISQISEYTPPMGGSLLYDEKLSVESNYKELLQKYVKLEEQYKLLESSSRVQIELLSQQVRYYENKCSELNSREKTKFILLERKSNRKSDCQSFAEGEKELQILHLINDEDVCYVSD